MERRFSCISLNLKLHQYAVNCKIEESQGSSQGDCDVFYCDSAASWQSANKEDEFPGVGMCCLGHLENIRIQVANAC